MVNGLGHANAAGRWGRGVLCAATASFAACAIGGAAAAQATECDRICLKGVADEVLASMQARSPAALPMARDYAATENLAPMAPNMMSPWSGVTAVQTRYYVLDPATQQIFLVATIVEGRRKALLYGRVALRDRRITELELYVNRSHGESGLMFDPDGPAALPAAWTQPVSGARRPSRASLLAAGRSMFDPAAVSPPAAPDCIVVEAGQTAHLSAALQAAVLGAKAAAAELAQPSKAVAVSCQASPKRPPDPRARADIVDEAQGVVVGLGLVTGTVSAYLAASSPESSFLPDAYYAGYRSLQARQRAADPDAPALQPMAAAAAVTQIYRIYDGRIQGFQRFIHVLPQSARSAWEPNDGP